MSGAEAIEKLYPELSNLQVSAVFPKPINSDDVLLYLHQLSIGEVPTLTDIIPQPIDEELFQPFRKLSRSVLANRPLKDRFRHVLENLVEQKSG